MSSPLALYSTVDFHDRVFNYSVGEVQVPPSKVVLWVPTSFQSLCDANPPPPPQTSAMVGQWSQMVTGFFFLLSEKSFATKQNGIYSTVHSIAKGLG